MARVEIIPIGSDPDIQKQAQENSQVALLGNLHADAAVKATERSENPVLRQFDKERVSRYRSFALVNGHVIKNI